MHINISSIFWKLLSWNAVRVVNKLFYKALFHAKKENILGK